MAGGAAAAAGAGIASSLVAAREAATPSAVAARVADVSAAGLPMVGLWVCGEGRVCVRERQGCGEGAAERAPPPLHRDACPWADRFWGRRVTKAGWGPCVLRSTHLCVSGRVGAGGSGVRGEGRAAREMEE